VELGLRRVLRFDLGHQRRYVVLHARTIVEATAADSTQPLSSSAFTEGRVGGMRWITCSPTVR
jgi:hypothetical protein